MRRIPIALGLLALFSAPGIAQESHNVTLLGQQHLYGVYSSCWGYTSPGGQELALIGTSDGTSIVDVSSPATPVELTFIPGASSPWRNIKTHDQYAYIVTEGTGGGMQIVDLLAAPPVLLYTDTTTFDTAHTLQIRDGYAYANGARKNGSSVGIRILSLANPTLPVDVGGWTDIYAHDCAVYGDTLYASCIGMDVVAVVDVTDKANPVTATTFAWPGHDNPHSGDLTQDRNYFLSTNEVASGDLHVFDIRDPNDIRQVATWTANPDAIIHNVHVQGDLAYVAYYTEGLRVVDIANPEYPVEVGFYDTWPGVSGGFKGNWEAYPYALSGNTYLSDIATGLYVVRFEQLDGGVEGFVTAEDTGAPLANALVELWQDGTLETATTIASGYYKMYEEPSASPMSLLTSHFGFHDDSTVVLLAPNTIMTASPVLERVPSSVVLGNVRSAFDASGIAEASIVVEGTPLTQSSDPSGGFHFPHVPHDVYVVTASRFGFVPERRTVGVAVQPDPLRVDFELDPALWISDFEVGPSGWVRESPADEAVSGLWVWADPVGSGAGGVQPEDDHTFDPGSLCWVTGNASNPWENIGTADVDAGRTILTSPSFDLSTLDRPSISYWRWYSNNAGSNPGEDTLHVDLSHDDGQTWVAVEDLVQSAPQWVQVTFLVSDVVPPTQQMRLRVTAGDLGLPSIVEAAFDDFMAFESPVTSTQGPPPASRLYPNVPNPFNPSTRIRFELAVGGRADLAIFDVRGRLVRNLVSAHLGPGLHERSWDGRDTRNRFVASGVYLLRLRAPGFVDSRRLVRID